DRARCPAKEYPQSRDARFRRRATGAASRRGQSLSCGGWALSSLKIVMPALATGIHVVLVESGKTWMAGISPAMTPHLQFINPRACKTWTYRERWIVSTR